MEKAWIAIAGGILGLGLTLHSCRKVGEEAQDRSDEPKARTTVSALHPTSGTSRSTPSSKKRVDEPPHVTSTWDHLRSQPPIHLSGGGAARVGMEASEAPIGGGLLVYCLNTGPAATSAQPHLLDALMKSPGPFHMDANGRPWKNGEMPAAGSATRMASPTCR